MSPNTSFACTGGHIHSRDHGAVLPRATHHACSHYELFKDCYFVTNIKLHDFRRFTCVGGSNSSPLVVSAATSWSDTERCPEICTVV